MTTRLKFATDATTSARMRKIRQRDTKAELTVRRWLWSAGLKYRVNNRDLPGSPDVANRSGRWAVFVHGCFWHGHEGCRRARLPSRNQDAWNEKILSNRARDERKARELASLGYEVITVWECELDQLAWHRELARLKALPRRRPRRPNRPPS